MGDKEGFTVEERLKILYILLDNKQSIDKTKAIDVIVEEGLTDKFFALHDFIWKKPEFNDWMVTGFRLEGKEFFGPQRRFSGMTFGDFIACDMLSTAYFKSKRSVELLNLLTAYLMRPKSIDETKADVRVQLNSELAKGRAEQFKKLHISIRYAVLFNFLAVRDWLTFKYSNVFPKPVEGASPKSIDFGDVNKSGWLSVRRQVAESVLNLQKVDELPMHEVLADFNNKISKK